jgi:hypothetical protein
VCISSAIHDIEDGKLPEKMIEIQKPVVCTLCKYRFADVIIMAKHTCANKDPTIINPKDLSVAELRRTLSEKGESTKGSKQILCERLENVLSYEMLLIYD